MTKGRKPHLTPEEAQHVRENFYDRSAKWNVSSLARFFRVNTTVITAVLNETGAYAKKIEKDEKNA